MHAGSGSIGAKLKEHGHRIAAGEGIVGYTAETGIPFFTNNVDESDLFQPQSAVAGHQIGADRSRKDWRENSRSAGYSPGPAKMPDAARSCSW